MYPHMSELLDRLQQSMNSN